MSAQCYINKRRVLAEASLRKTQYPGSIGVNNNPIYASINSKPDFTELLYIINRCCVKFHQSYSEPITPKIFLILKGGRSTTMSNGIIDGGNTLTNSYDIIDGGNS